MSDVDQLERDTRAAWAAQDFPLYVMGLLTLVAIDPDRAVELRIELEPGWADGPTPPPRGPEQ